jgi:hypothetical protein
VSKSSSSSSGMPLVEIDWRSLVMVSSRLKAFADSSDWYDERRSCRLDQPAEEAMREGGESRTPNAKSFPVSPLPFSCYAEGGDNERRRSQN